MHVPIRSKHLFPNPHKDSIWSSSLLHEWHPSPPHSCIVFWLITQVDDSIYNLILLSLTCAPMNLLIREKQQDIKEHCSFHHRTCLGSSPSFLFIFTYFMMSVKAHKPSEPCFPHLSNEDWEDLLGWLLWVTVRIKSNNLEERSL